MKEIIIPSVQQKPICLIGFLPNDINRSVFELQIKETLKAQFSFNPVTKKTFDANTYFSIGDRLMYVPEMKKSRKYIKVQVEQQWLLEKPEYKIDPTYGMYDLLVFEGKVYIRLLFTNSVHHKLITQISQSIATALSIYGETYFIYHKRIAGTSTISDTEYFMAINSGRVSDEIKKGPGSQKDGIRYMIDRYAINLEKIIETLDMGIEIQCAPYDLKEYHEKLKFLNSAKHSNISNIKLSEDDNDTIEDETIYEIKELEALIKSTNNIIEKYSNIDLETIYFKLPTSVIQRIL